MNSFTDGKPLDQTTASSPIVINRGNTSPRYGLFGFLILLGILGYTFYDLQSTKKELRQSQQTQFAALEAKLDSWASENEKSLAALNSDVKVVGDKLGVTKKELDNARSYAQRLKAEQEQSGRKKPPPSLVLLTRMSLPCAPMWKPRVRNWKAPAAIWSM